MLFSITKRNVTRATLHRFYVSLAGNNFTLATSQRRSKDSVLQCITLKHNAIPHRHMMYKNNKTIEFLPLLPDHMYKRTTLLQNLSVFFSIGYLRRIDPDFSLKDVLQCMAKVVQKVSSDLVQRNYESLNGLVDEDALKALEKRIDSLSFAERNVLELKESEIMACIPIYIKIANAAEHQSSSSPTARVDFNTIVYYRPACAVTAGDPIPVVLAANYLFVRDYIPNQDTDWTIKYINYARKCIYSGY